MKKKFFTLLAAVVFSFFPLSLFSQEVDEDSFDSMFDEVEDVVVEEAKAAPVPENSQKQISFSGSLDTELGAGIRSEPGDPISPAAYFSFENYFYMTARASDVFSLKATLFTSLPTFELTLHEIYFNYLLRLIISSLYLQVIFSLSYYLGIILVILPKGNNILIYYYITIVITTTYKVLKNLLLLVVVSKVPKGHKQSDEDNH